ncbi:hypothetical protein VitviT2T_028524 [Vitis vinifera]|uniref:UBN2 domain-containing protein n=1 Tax=Vitis vinifera TaxID=29760 RepID=A0ABY9DV09_VITVI|nr:hypothetical protein VitviT2T_028524 [Vitis vinifera]
MFSRFLVIVNKLEALGKTFTEVEKVMKILRSLPRKWETKVTTIQEAKDLTKLSLEELIGSLMTYEIELYNHQRVEENEKSIAFMAITNDDEEEESESESDESHQPDPPTAVIESCHDLVGMAHRITVKTNGGLSFASNGRSGLMGSNLSWPPLYNRPFPSCFRRC